MRHISESIIGRRGDYKSSKISGNIYSGQDLEYGDVVLWGSNTYYIYLPYSQCKSWWNKFSPRSKSQALLVRYSPSNNIYHACYNDDTSNCKFVRYISEYRNIKTPEDLKRIFDKYNIPYE